MIKYLVKGHMKDIDEPVHYTLSPEEKDRVLLILQCERNMDATPLYVKFDIEEYTNDLLTATFLYDNVKGCYIDD